MEREANMETSLSMYIQHKYVSKGGSLRYSLKFHGIGDE